MPRDIAALDAVLSSYRGIVYGYFRARGVAAASAENLAQQTFLRWYQTRHRPHDDKSWLLATASELLREHIRTARNGADAAWSSLCLELDDAAPEGLPQGASDEIQRCLDLLSPSLRDALELKYRTRENMTAFASRLRRSETAARGLLSRARQSLRHCLKHQLIDPLPEDERSSAEPTPPDGSQTVT